MGQHASALGADAQGQLQIAHVKAWAPYTQWAGSHSARLSQVLQHMSPGQSTVPAADLAAILSLPAGDAAPVAESWVRQGPKEILAPLLRTGVSSEDLLITLNMLLEDSAEQGDGSVEGLTPGQLEKLQEALDQLVEARGPEGEGVPIDGAQLASALERTVPLLQQAALLTRLAREVEAQGMGGDGASAAAAAPTAASAASASSSSVAASSSAPRRAAAGSKASSASAGGSMGGGLDLSISGFSIKPPGKK